MVSILSIAGSGIPSSSAQLKSQKRITSLQSSETALGTRVSLFSDLSLGDYEAFRRGDRFYIKVPSASFDAAQPNLRGDGFEDIQVQRVGDSLVVSFRLQPGTSARVDQRSNRLDVYFTSPNKTPRNTSSNGQSTRTTTSSGIVTLETARSQHVLRNPNAAGPTPPDTPGASRPRVATPQQANYRVSSEPTVETSQYRRSVSQEPSGRANTQKKVTPSEPKPDSSVSLKPDSDRSSRDSNTPTSLTPSATPYQPSTAATPYSSFTPRPVSTSSTTSSSSGWAKRFDGAKQWLSMNRLAAGIAGTVLVALILLSLAFLYRRRRQPIQAKHKKVPGVQPKFSEARESNDFQADFGTEEYETVFDDYTGTRSKLNANTPIVRESEAAEETQLWEDEFEPNATGLRAKNAATSNIPATPMVPIHAMKHDEYEREVFEL